MKRIIIAIDGYSSCGKSTMAKDLAQSIGYIYIDTGAMYRAVTLYALRHGFFQNGGIDTTALEKSIPHIHITFRLDPSNNLPRTYLNDEDVEDAIRTLEVSSHVSPIAALPFVREALTVQQRAMGEEKGIVMDGRDIGTSVFPKAELKIFVTASPEIRALRRYNELLGKGQSVDLEAIRKNVEERDYIDTHREVSPLKQAPDALVLDNSHLTKEEQKEWLLSRFKERSDINS